MSDKLQELTEKLYIQGLSKGKEEGKLLLSRAREEADRIVSDARTQAAAIISDASVAIIIGIPVLIALARRNAKKTNLSKED